MRRQTTIRHTAAAVLCALSAGLLSACSAPSAPEAGNVIETAPATTRSATFAAVDTTIAEIVASGSVSPSTVPVFVPPSTTLPDDPDLREAIRVRIAVEAEYRRQDRLGIADPAGFDSLGDPTVWTPRGLATLNKNITEGRKVREGTIATLFVTAAKFQSADEIALDVCFANDDVTTEATGEGDSSLAIFLGQSLMTRREGKWLYSGSAWSRVSSC